MYLITIFDQSLRFDPFGFDPIPPKKFGGRDGFEGMDSIPSVSLYLYYTFIILLFTKDTIVNTTYVLNTISSVSLYLYYTSIYER